MYVSSQTNTVQVSGQAQIALGPIGSATPQGTNWYGSNNQASDPANPWTYDPSGSGDLLTIPALGERFTYDAENRQLSATVGSTATYGYDGNGQRVSKTVNGQTTIYVYDAFGDLAAEYGSTAANMCDTTTCCLTEDHLGSRRMVTDSNGAMTRRYDYLPFGQEIMAGFAGRTVANGFQGKRVSLN